MIRFYDNGIVEYLKENIIVDDGEDDGRTPQVIFALPSKNSLSVDMSDNNTPIFPILTVTRDGFTRHEISGIVKTHLSRPFIHTHSRDKKNIYGSDFLPYNINYKIDVWSLTHRMHTDIITQLLWLMEKKPSVPVNGVVSNREIRMNGYIEGYDISDSTTYDELSDENMRMFRTTLSIKLFGWLTKIETNKKTVFEVLDNIKIHTSNPDDMNNIPNNNDFGSTNTTNNGSNNINNGNSNSNIIDENELNRRIQNQILIQMHFDSSGHYKYITEKILES
jgi:hypothetical protein